MAAKAQQLHDLPRLLELAAARVSNLADVADMGGQIGMKRNTAERYLTLLELLFLVRQSTGLEPKHRAAADQVPEAMASG